MNSKLKKCLKIVLWAVGIIVLIPIVLIATLPLWLGPIVRPSVNAIVPQITKTDFKIEKLYLNPYTCNFEIGGVRVGNPEGFAETNAVALGYFNIDVDTASLFSDVIVVENIEIKDIYFSLVKTNGSDKTNLDIIQENILGAKDELSEEIEKERAKQEEAERQAGKSEEEIKAEEEAEEKALNKKIIVKRIAFSNISGKYGMMPISVPATIELKDIGQDSGGYDIDHIIPAILKEFWASLMSSAIDVTNLVGDQAGKALDSLKGAGGSLKDVGNSFKGLFKDKK